MTLTVRSITGSPQSYVASAPAPDGKSAFLLHFHPDIFGAMSLYEFAEMLRSHHGLPQIDLAFRDTALDPRDGSLLSLLDVHE